MATIPTITETDIRDFVGDRNFLLGQQYARRGAVTDTRHQGMTLKARCQGSRPDAYRVEVTFDREGIEDANCSCPVGYVCKHIAALLLVWRQQPEEFVEQQDVDVLLEQCSKPELISLIKKMLRREPDLEMMLETVGNQKGTINLESYRRKVKKAFQEGGREWGDIYEVADELVDIKESADAAAEKQDYSSAVTIYEFIMQGVIDYYYLYQDQDENGELTGFVNGCVEALDALLSHVLENADLRERLLRILFDVFNFNIKSGGIGIGEDAADIILRQANTQERPIVADWVRKELANEPDEDDNHNFGMSDWNRKHLGGFLLELEADTLDDETFLRIARETGRITDVVNRLLDLGRVDEALTEADQTSDFDLFRMLPIFTQHEQGDRVEELVRKRLIHPQNAVNSVDMQLQTWLKQRYLDRHDLASALRISEQMFRGYPTLPYYQEIRGIASELHQWNAKRQELLSFLEQQQNTQLLIQIALDEGDIDRALELLKTIKQPDRPYGYGYIYDSYTPLALEVAKAAEETRPQAAIDIYQHVAERLIDLRGRGNYQTACGYLMRVRELYERLGKHDTWMSYVTNLRDKNRSLRALKEEMQEAGLL
jgi:uncharacterized Zn finger protein